jgi:hypothetical protein
MNLELPRSGLLEQKIGSKRDLHVFPDGAVPDSRSINFSVRTIKTTSAFATGQPSRPTL